MFRSLWASRVPPSVPTLGRWSIRRSWRSQGESGARSADDRDRRAERRRPKTSSAPDLLRDAIGIDTFVHADVLAQGLNGFRPESAAFEAGPVMLRRLNGTGWSASRLRVREHFRGAVGPAFSQAPDPGWLRCSHLPSGATVPAARIRTRVAAGGHDVPDQLVRRRFSKSQVNSTDSIGPWRRRGDSTRVAFWAARH